MVPEILTYMREQHMFQPAERITVALSGGADSVCLFHLLRQIEEVQLSAIHVHHGIRATADRDEAFVRNLCQRYQVPLAVCHVRVPEEAARRKAGLEETARSLRYEAFEALDTDHIALAHHSMDQAETMLLHLCRGAGLNGLSGMLPVRGRYIRPLLKTEPEQIRAYLTEHGYTWVEDETNQDPAYRRNFIRSQILPQLAEHVNPQTVRHMAQTASWLQEDRMLLDQMAAQALEQNRSGEALSVSGLTELPKALRRRVFLLYLAELGLEQDLGQEHFAQMDALLDSESGSRIDLPRDVQLERSYDTIRPWSAPEQAESCVIAEVPWHGRIDRFALEVDVSFVENVKFDGFSEKKYTKTFDYDTIKDTLVLRTRRAGDYLTMAGGRKTLKAYMIDEKIPRYMRDQVPLLADGSHILWVIGHRMSDGCKLSEHTKRAVQVSVTDFQSTKGK